MHVKRLFPVVRNNKRKKPRWCKIH